MKTQFHIPSAMICVTLAASVQAAADVIYVNASAPDRGNGTSWATAFNDLQDGLAAATPDSGDQLWVAAGIYKPAGQGGDRAISFNIVSGTAIYGGFNGSETKLEERDPAVNITILSGDLNGNDTGPVDDPTHSENSYHVVKATSTISGTLVDGLKITSGLANGSTPHGVGGGMSVSASTVDVANCTIDANFAQASGGGLVANSSTLTLRNCRFHENVSLNGPGGGLLSNFGDIFIYDCEFIANEVRRGGFGRAGGAWIWGGTIELTRCLFESNTSGWQTGGLELEEGSARIVECRFVGNTAVGYGPGGLLSFASVEVIDCQFVDNHGAIAGGAAGVVEHPFGPARFVNCLFAGNSAYRGGAIYMQEANAEFINCVVSGNNSSGYGGGIYVTGDAVLHHCTIVGNTAHEEGGGVNRITSGSTVNVSNSILWGNTDPNGDGEAAQLFNGLGTGSIQFSAVQGWTGALGGVGNFGLDPLFEDADGPDNTVGTEDDNLRLSAASPCVNNGDPLFVLLHPVDIDGQPRVQECIVDLGAYEATDADPLLPDCNLNGVQDACDIASQTSQDCNNNVIPDECDLAGGFSADLDANGIPDECQGVPINNLCGGAKVAFSGNNAFTNVNATTEGPSEPAGCGFGGDAQIHNDVWFRYPAQCAGIVNISLCGANFDARLAVYVGCPSQPGQMIACSDNDCGTSPRVSFLNSTTTIYRVRIGGSSAGTPGMGGGTMVITCTPSAQCPGDASGDGNVNITDLLLVITNWGQSGLNPADVNGDSVVNITDLLGVIAGWGPC